MAEEARDPVRSIPSSIRATVAAVFVMYAGIPLVGLSALPVHHTANGYETELGTKFANDPILGIVDNFGFGGHLLDVLRIYVGLLAATILLIATNAGIIGVSRLTFSMGAYRQLPAALRRVHPRFRTPALAIVVFCGVAALVLIPGKTDFLANMYAYGAMLSFTTAHAAILVLRLRRRGETLPWRGRPNLRLGRLDLPLFAALGGLGTGLAFIAVLFLHGDARIVGTAWMAVGFAGYVLYRRRQGLSLVRTATLSPLETSTEVEVSYTNILVPVSENGVSEEMMVTAGMLAADQGTTIEALTVIEVPINLPLSAELPGVEEAADRLLERAKGIGEEYGAKVVTHAVRARQAGRAIVDEARQLGVEVIMLGAPARRRIGDRLFGRTTDYVLRNAPCRVIISSDRAPAVATAAAVGAAVARQSRERTVDGGPQEPGAGAERG